jgi:hypothetical protein
MCNQSGWENIKQAKGKEYFPFFRPLTPLCMRGLISPTGRHQPFRPSTTTKLTTLTFFFHIRVVTTFELTIFFHPRVVTTFKLTIFFHPRVVTTSNVTIFFHPRVVTTSKLTIFFILGL